jgi:general secretion pathway protein G
MNNRKRGFSLVELLIVLAVIAALIATITPVAMNAIKKAKATQVAQNLKTLASALENAAYVNGVGSNGRIEEVTKLSDLGRDINGEEYAVYYTGTSGQYTVRVISLADAAIDQVKTALKDAFTETWDSGALSNMANYVPLTGTNWSPSGEVIAYTFTFNVY